MTKPSANTVSIETTENVETNSEKLSEIQSELDQIQNSGISPQKVRHILFNKMLDIYQVPLDHPFRNSPTPERIDDPLIIEQLTQAGFKKVQKKQVH